MQELEYLKERLQQQIDEYVNTLASGLPGADPQAVAMAYKYTCGLIAGFVTARDIVDEMSKKIAETE